MPRQVQSLTAAAEERVTDQGVRGRTTPEPAERMGPTQARAEIAERSYRDSPVGGRDTVEGRDTCEPTRRRSEGYSLDEGGVVTGIWREVFRKANPGALVVFLDNGHSDFTTAFDEVWTCEGLERVHIRDRVTFTPRYSEESAGRGEGLHQALRPYTEIEELGLPSRSSEAG